MTIHAGEKAARLRRATATSSANNANVTSPNSKDTEIGQTQLHLAEQCKMKTPRHHSLSSSSKTKKDKQGPCRSKRNAEEYLQSNSDYFVFSGIEPLTPQPQDVREPFTWDTHDKEYSQVTTFDTSPNMTTVLFVQQPSRNEVTGKSKQQDTIATTPKSVPESPQSPKASPRSFLPWFLSLSSTSKQRASEDAEHVCDNIEHTQSADEGASQRADRNQQARKKKKKKAKKKHGAEARRRPEEDSQSVGSACRNRKQNFVNSTTMNGPMSPVDAAEDHPDVTSGSTGEKCGRSQVSGILIPHKENLGETGTRVLCAQHLDVLQPAENSLTSASISSYDSDAVIEHVQADLDHKRSTSASTPSPSEEQHTVHLAVLKRSGDLAEDQGLFCERRISRTDTETSYITADSLFPSPLQPNGVQSLAQGQQQHVHDGGARSGCLNSPYCPLPPNTTHVNSSAMTTSSTRSSLTEASLSKIDENFCSSQSSPFLLLVGDKSDGLQIKTGTLNPSLETQPKVAFPSIVTASPHEVAASVPNRNCSANDECVRDYVDGGSTKVGPGQLERHRRTLDWRLASASSSPHTYTSSSSAVNALQDWELDTQPSTQVERISSVEVAKTSNESIIRRKMQVCLSSHLEESPNEQKGLPAFEEIHPRRSAEREEKLRSLSWLGLEEYVARRSRLGSSTDQCGASVWITHSCFARGTSPSVLTNSPREPPFAPSSLLLRNTKVMGGKSAFNSNTALTLYRAALARRKERRSSGQISTPTKEHLQKQHSSRLDNDPALSFSMSHALSDVLPASQGIATEHSRVPLIKLTVAKDRHTCLDLQRKTEKCMYELRNSKGKDIEEHHWLQSLQGIAKEEKESICSFLRNSTVEWLRSPPESAILSDVQNIRNATLDGDYLGLIEPIWPTTPYTPMAVGSDCTDLDRGDLASNAFTTNEVAEMEDAMYRDLLHQSNQSGYFRANRKKERAYSHTRPGHHAGTRARAASHSNRNLNTPSPSTSYTRKLQTFSTNRERGQDRRPGFALRGKGLSDASTFIRGSETNQREGQKLPILGTESMNLSRRGRLDLSDKELHASKDELGSVDSVEARRIEARSSQQGITSAKETAKETEDQAIRHSLATLQRHLSLFAAQKKLVDTLGNSVYDRLQDPNVVQQQHLRVPPASEPQKNWQNMSFDSPQQQYAHMPLYHSWFDASPTSVESHPSPSTFEDFSQHLFRAELKRQQEAMEREARQLEQRHFDSYAQAMERQRSNASLDSSARKEQATQDVARLRAALASEWARHGQGEANVELYPGSSELQLSLVESPSITLTEPGFGSLQDYLQGKDSPYDARRPASEDLVQRSVLPWQALSSILPLPSGSGFAGADPTLSSDASSLAARRHSTQVLGRLDIGSALNGAVERRSSLGQHKSQREVIPTGPKRKTKQRDLTSLPSTSAIPGILQRHHKQLCPVPLSTREAARSFDEQWMLDSQRRMKESIGNSTANL